MPEGLNGMVAFSYCNTPLWKWYFCFIKEHSLIFQWQPLYISPLWLPRPCLNSFKLPGSTQKFLADWSIIEILCGWHTIINEIKTIKISTVFFRKIFLHLCNDLVFGSIGESLEVYFCVVKNAISTGFFNCCFIFTTANPNNQFGISTMLC